MPAEFKKLVKELIDQGKTEEQAYAIATSAWKKKYGTTPQKSAGESVQWVTIPILSEAGEQSGRRWVNIGGVALTETISSNNRKYTIKNIMENDGNEVSVFSEHRPYEEHVVGKAKLFNENGILKYDARIRNTASHPDIVEKCEDGLLRVSIGASEFTAKKDKDGIAIIENLRINHLGLVGIAGIKEVTMDYAIAESAQMKMDDEELMDDEIKKEMEKKKKQKELDAKKPEVKKMDEAELQKLVEENKKLKEQIEIEKKMVVIERLIEMNKDLKKEELLYESIDVLKMRLDYEKKISESVAKPKQKEGAGAGVVESTEGDRLRVDELKGIIVESDGRITMNDSLYKQFQKEVAESIYR